MWWYDVLLTACRIPAQLIRWLPSLRENNRRKMSHQSESLRQQSRICHLPFPFQLVTLHRSRCAVAFFRLVWAKQRSTRIQITDVVRRVMTPSLMPAGPDVQHLLDTSSVKNDSAVRAQQDARIWWKCHFVRFLREHCKPWVVPVWIRKWLEMCISCSDSVHGDKGTGQHSTDVTPGKTRREHTTKQRGTVQFTSSLSVSLSLLGLVRCPQRHDVRGLEAQGQPGPHWEQLGHPVKNWLRCQFCWHKLLRGGTCCSCSPLLQMTVSHMNIEEELGCDLLYWVCNEQKSKRARDKKGK